VKLLLDTHILLWCAENNLPAKFSQYVLDAQNTLYFSHASIWEVSIKYNLGRMDFKINPRELYDGLLSGGYKALPIHLNHIFEISKLPNIHKDPFDRILLSQAISENCFLLTADKILASYPGPIISA